MTLRGSLQRLGSKQGGTATVGLVLIGIVGCTPTPTPGATVFLARGTPQPNQTIDVVFVPDNDYGDISVASNRQALLDDVDDMIDQGFGMNQGVDVNLSLFTFWFMTSSGDVQPGTGTCPSVTWPNLTDALFAEVIVLLHPDTSLRNCAWGNRVTASIGSHRTVVHETSHAAFGLPDEYCCDGGYWSVSPVLYSSQASCDADGANTGWRDCRSFTAGNGAVWWRSEDTHCDMMACGGPPGDWQRVLEYGPADWYVVEGVLAGLPGATVAPPSTFAPSEWP